MPAIDETVESYLDQLPAERAEAFAGLRNVIRRHLPKGFSEVFASGMIHYVVPHSKYPAGYHCNPKQGLPFISIASQKGFIALYHMGMYGDPKLLKWFTSEYPKHSEQKLDMGKSCVRFKKPEFIPLGLIGELVSKITPDDWITLYEKNLKR
jgi:hypothetical protein